MFIIQCLFQLVMNILLYSCKEVMMTTMISIESNDDSYYRYSIYINNK